MRAPPSTASASLSGKLSASVAQPRFAALLLALFAALGLAVAATGLYGVLSYSVTERRREIGVRAALGATRGTLVRLVLRQGLAFTIAGLALGLLAAAGASQFLSSLLFGVTPYDTVAFADRAGGSDRRRTRRVPRACVAGRGGRSGGGASRGMTAC